jgi:hypothetical protein
MSYFGFMKAADMKRALGALDALLDTPTQLLIGGGAAMALAYNLPLVTADIDAQVFKSQITQAELTPLVHKVAQQLQLPKDWINSYFNTFLFALPSDYASRLKQVLSGKHLKAFALGREDMVILKCMAGRDKDMPHARALMKQGVDRSIIEHQLQTLIDKKIPKADRAMDFFDELCDQVPE